MVDDLSILSFHVSRITETLIVVKYGRETTMDTGGNIRVRMIGSVVSKAVGLLLKLSEDYKAFPAFEDAQRDDVDRMESV
jgi:hypothetical protein